MAKVPNGEEKLPKISTGWVECTNVTDRRQTELEFNVPFQHKYGYIRDKRSRVDSYPYPVKEGQRYINLNPGRLFVQ